MVAAIAQTPSAPAAIAWPASVGMIATRFPVSGSIR
jgi:hypothetical protein